MADTTYNYLDVRVNHKIDTFENWMASTFTLNAGELAIATISARGEGANFTPPAVAIKVGDGSKKFSELSWIQSTAGDVYAWAKKGSLDFADLDDAFKANLDTYINNEVQDSNTTYSFEFSNNQLVVKSKEIGDTEFKTEVARITLDLTTKMDKVTGATSGNLAQFDGNGQVVDSGKKISDYLTSKDAADTYATVEDLDGLSKTVTEQGTQVETNKSDIATLKTQIVGVTGAMHFAGISTTDPAEGTVTINGEVYTAKKGDVVIYKTTTNPVADVEYVYDGEGWVELGDVTAEGQRITALETVVGTDAEKGLQKAVADNTSAIDGMNETLSGVKTKAESAVQSISGVTATKNGTDVEVTGVPVTLLKDVANNILVLNCGTASTVI